MSLQNKPANPTECDKHRIDTYLNGLADPNQQRLLDQHLQNCVECRTYMRGQAAADALWNDAAILLRDDELDNELFLENHSSTSLGELKLDAESANQKSRTGTINAVLKSLTPGEHPNHLGRLNNYEITGVIGAGGMGVVLKANDSSLDRTVAIKVMSPFLAASGAARKRFDREAKATAAVIHPNVISIIGVSGESAPLPYLVMAYSSGSSLEKRLRAEGPFKTNAILRIGAQVAAGLAAAHDQGLVHRDIKPANIMLGKGVERIAITDFGLARAVDDASITREGSIAGTPQFMSPEQARGEAVSQKSDLFSLGSLLYALATGRPPFRADTSFGVMKKIIDQQPTSIRELNPEIPDWLCAFIEKLMNKSPQHRFDSADEVATLLEKSLAHVQRPTGVSLPKAVKDLTKTHLLDRSLHPRNFLTRNSTKVIAMIACTIALIAALINFIPSIQQDDSRDADSKQIAKELAIWKEHDFESQTEGEQETKLTELHNQHVGEEGSKEFLKNKTTWATELLPILLSGVEENKAQFLIDFTEPFEAIREADRAAAKGETTNPIGWEWQTVHMLALGRRGFIDDSYRENDLLVQKILTNINNQTGRSLTANYFGEEQSLQEILRECRLHRAVIEAIDGPPMSGTDAENADESQQSTENTIHALGILLDDQRTAMKVWALAKADPTEANFSQLAKQYSVEPASRENSGNIPNITADSELFEHVAELNPGSFSDIVQIDDKWVLLFRKKESGSNEHESQNARGNQQDQDSDSGSNNNDTEKNDDENVDLPNELAEQVALIPERRSLFQADEKYLAIYELDGDEIIAKAIRDDEVAAEVGIACWNRLTTLFPSKYREGLVQFNIQGGTRWAGFFNGSGSNDVGRKGYSLSIAKYQALKEKDVANPNRPVTPNRGTLDWTTVHEMGHYICLTTDAIELFSQEFDGDDRPQPKRRKKPDDYPEDGTPVLDGNFVTSYAERTPGDEEVCETFTTYLLVKELPKNDSLVAKKIRFFDSLPGYPELRAHVQSVGSSSK